MNAKRVKELLSQIKVATAELEKELNGADSAPVDAPKSEKTPSKTATPAKGDRRAELEALSYNDLKKEAKNCRVKAVGGKDDLINAILGAGAPAVEKETKPAKAGKTTKVEEAPAEEDDEDGVDVEAILAELDDKGVKELAKACGIAVKVGAKVANLKKSILEVEDDVLVEALIQQGLVEGVDEDAEGEEDGAEGEEELTVQEQVETATAEMSDAELKNFLKEAGLAVTGKRQAWVARLVEAVEAGEVSLGEEDEEDTDGDEEAQEVDLNEMTDEEIIAFAEENEVSDLVAYKGKGKNKKFDRDATIEALTEAFSSEEGEEGSEVDFDEMTEERETACKKFEADTRKAIKAKKLKLADVVKFLKQAQGDSFDADMTDADKYELYIELNKRLIDDEGEAHDFGEPYSVNEVPVCCGQALQLLDNGNLYCEVCGEEFETEEE